MKRPHPSNCEGNEKGVKLRVDDDQHGKPEIEEAIIVAFERTDLTEGAIERNGPFGNGATAGYCLRREDNSDGDSSKRSLEGKSGRVDEIRNEASNESISDEGRERDVEGARSKKDDGYLRSFE